MTAPPIGDGGSLDLVGADATQTLDGPVFADDLGSDPGAPTIDITEPVAMSDVKYDTLKVKATITAGPGTSIDASSVKLLLPTGVSGTTSVDMSLTATANVYEGQIDISSIPSGNSEFAVTAADTMGRRATAKRAYRHDRGPRLTFVQPSKPTATGSVSVLIVVEDPLYPIMNLSQVKAWIRSEGDITLAQVTGADPFRVEGTITFNNNMWKPPLEGPQLITAQATNSSGTVGQASKQFTVDNAGPLIALENPVPGQFIGGVLEIRAKITDLSGVNEGSVIAVFGGNSTKSVALKRVMPGKDDFSGLFDVRQLGTSYVLPALSVRADDTLGNHGETAIEIIIDNTPMQMELDPPLMRVAKIDQGIVKCSQLFDPVGRESADDGEVVPQIVALKARIEDRGNSAPGLLVERFSGLESSSVVLFATPGAQQLAVDTDEDGQCDDINPLLIPTTNVTASNEALALDMDPLLPGGGGDYTGLVTPAPAPFTGSCGQIGDAAMTPPDPICKRAGTSLTIVLPYADPLPPIWTIPPVRSNDTDCIGFQLDSLNRLPEGATCVVVRARDRAGNVNVTPPLRICLNRGNGMCNAFMPTNCTGTYTKATGTTSAVPCTPRVIQRGMSPNPNSDFNTRFPRDPNGAGPNDPIEVRIL